MYCNTKMVLVSSPGMAWHATVLQDYRAPQLVAERALFELVRQHTDSTNIGTYCEHSIRK